MPRREKFFCAAAWRCAGKGRGKRIRDASAANHPSLSWRWNRACSLATSRARSSPWLSGKPFLGPCGLPLAWFSSGVGFRGRALEERVSAWAVAPVAIKAAGGGGGKGFRVAETEDDLESAFAVGVE